MKTHSASNLVAVAAQMFTANLTRSSCGVISILALPNSSTIPVANHAVVSTYREPESCRRRRNGHRTYYVLISVKVKGE
jgi:hypothetical protein